MVARPKWVLLDRDGTINVPAPEGAYITQPSALRLLEGAGEAVARLNAAGLPIAVVTNQRGVALGRMTLQDLDVVHAELEQRLAEHGARVDLIVACPHERGTCDCRKPQPGMLLRASRELGLPLREAVMVGDSEVDVQAAAAAGAESIRIADPHEQSASSVSAPSLWAAVTLLLGEKVEPCTGRR